MNPLVSVIVPIFNTARWLPQAVASLDRQTYRSELEAILVDDGSNDGSSDIARKLAATAPGVRYVHQANAGLGAARNHGLRLARGRYVGFLDSDDLYAPNGLDRLVALAQRYQAKIAVGDMHGFPPRPSPPWRRALLDHPYDRVVDCIGDVPDLVGNPSACNKIFVREFVVSQGARFTEGTAFEDVLFTLPLMLVSDRTAITPKLAYLYRRRGDGSSIMDSRSQPRKIMQHLTIIEELLCLSRDTNDRTQRAVQRWVAYMQLHYAGRAAGSLSEEQFDEFCSRMAAMFKNIPLEATAEYVHGVEAAMRAVAIYENDVPGVREAVTSAPLRVSDGTVYAGHADIGVYGDLLALNGVRAAFTNLCLVEGKLELRGRCIVPMLRVEAGELRPDLVVELGQSTTPVESMGSSTSVIEFRCAIDVHRHGIGRHQLRFAVRDGEKLARRRSPCRWPTRSITLPDGRFARLTVGDGTQLVISSRRQIGSVALWSVVRPIGRGAAWVGRRGIRGMGYAVRYAREQKRRYFE